MGWVNGSACRRRSGTVSWPFAVSAVRMGAKRFARMVEAVDGCMMDRCMIDYP
jgi:hypothetical protein